ncbi:hypothetical protein GCM10012320_10750 [Sinomonas cellulolyticus]|jgi:hypothetical protein|uniref:DUF2630 family protein n=1 Tax=Sinomonas cellulolyticus TaxID=2801916 RepID=A0ABS1K4F6_9MICC|nr:MULTISPECIES: DUF2630 family protein [Sinomonas]MBL0706531.1 DUF2630 family protein [Sinomonas cellulolyticus]GHG45134.1 hypothetical protein GCM10012320_10750 [Sinomonas sp. KCTC 49339]
MDKDILDRIRDLIDEEHTLRAEHPAGTGTDASNSVRLGEVEEQLDQCWDLLRQRRAKREFGEDPDEASVRPADVVEHYRE